MAFCKMGLILDLMGQAQPCLSIWVCEERGGTLQMYKLGSCFELMGQANCDWKIGQDLYLVLKQMETLTVQHLISEQAHIYGVFHLPTERGKRKN